MFFHQLSRPNPVWTLCTTTTTTTLRVWQLFSEHSLQRTKYGDKYSMYMVLVCFLYARLQMGRIMVWWCPSGSPSVRPPDSPSVQSPSAHFPHFSPSCFDIFSWNFAHDFVFDVLQIKFDCRHFASIYEGVMPLCELRIKVMCSFPHFSPTCFDILSSNFAYDFVSPYYRSTSSAVNLR